MALNAITLAMASKLESEGIKVSAVSAGLTKTNLNNYAGTETFEEDATEAVRVALLGPDGFVSDERSAVVEPLLLVLSGCLQCAVSSTARKHLSKDERALGRCSRSILCGATGQVA